MQILEATSENFDDRVNSPGELVVVDFWGPGCPNCEVFAADIPALLKALEGAPVRIVRVNAYADEDLARRFGLAGIPAFILLREGRVIGRMSEYYGRAWWLGVIRDHLPGGDSARGPGRTGF